MCEAQSALQGRMAKAQAEQAGMKDFDPKAAHLVCSHLVASLGFTTEVTETNAQEVVIKVGRCPAFEAAQLLGQDLQTSEAGCRAEAIRFMDTVVKQLNPRLRYELRKYRSAPEDSCVEAIVLT
jgi:hypothetical protein